VRERGIIISLGLPSEGVAIGEDSHAQEDPHVLHCMYCTGPILLLSSLAARGLTHGSAAVASGTVLLESRSDDKPSFRIIIVLDGGGAVEPRSQAANVLGLIVAGSDLSHGGIHSGVAGAPDAGMYVTEVTKMRCYIRIAVPVGVGFSCVPSSMASTVLFVSIRTNAGERSCFL
jgi:hypothetical protein